jgi:hypothetical protein
MTATLPPILLAYTPFLHPIPVWDYWLWLLVPLTVGVSIVYKSMKCRNMSDVPREAAQIAVLILLGMAAAAALLWVIVRAREAMV